MLDAQTGGILKQVAVGSLPWGCLLYTSDAADERSSVDLGGRRIIKKKTAQEYWYIRRNTNKTSKDNNIALDIRDKHKTTNHN